MNQLKFVLMGLVALCSILGMANGGKIINCYYHTWHIYLLEEGKVKPDNIDPTLCTHLTYYSFSTYSAGSGKFSMLVEPQADLALALSKMSVALKKQNQNLKVMASIGDYYEPSGAYSKIAGDANKRHTFVNSTLAFVQKHGFDGVDLNWASPGRREGSNNFVTLLSELKQALKAQNLQLGITVSASPTPEAISYDIPKVAENVDFVNVMAYDYYTSGSPIIGANAPLRSKDENNVEATVKYWLKAGVPAEKLVLGLGFYGQSFKLANPQQAQLGAAAAGPGATGPYNRNSSRLAYNEICSIKGNWSQKWDEEQAVPYMHNSQELIFYDNTKSIGMKVDFAKSMNLSGVMIWSSAEDDFRGSCGGPKFPLLKTINNHLGNTQDMSTSGNQLPAETVSVPQGTAPAAAAGANNNFVDAGDCLLDGFYRNESNCSKFYRCNAGTRYDYDCPTGLHFDTAASICNWSDLVQC